MCVYIGCRAIVVRQFYCRQHRSTPGQVPNDARREGPIFSENLVYQQWMYGFITAINLSRIEADQIRVDNAAVDLWMRNYCNKYPTDDFSRAAAMFVQELSKK